MKARSSLCFLICLQLVGPTGRAQAQFFRSLSKVEEAANAARAARAAEGAAKVEKAAEEAEAIAKAANGARKTEQFHLAAATVKHAYRFQNLTRELDKIEVFAVVNGESTVFLSNYVPTGWYLPVQLTVGKRDLLDIKTLTKYLVYDEQYVQPSESFDQAFQKEIILKVDPEVLTKYPRINFGESQNIYLFDGTNSYRMRFMEDGKGNSEPLIELKKNVYKRVVPEEFCTAVDYTSLLYDATAFLTNSDKQEYEAKDVEMDIEDPAIVKATHAENIADLISNLTSAGFTVIDQTCSAEEKIEKYVFHVIKDPDESDVFLAAADKFSEIKVKVHEHSGGLTVGWWILIAIVALGIIGFLVKD